MLAGVLMALILASEYLATDLPWASVRITLSVSSSICFASALSLGPTFGALVAASSSLIFEVYQRRAPIKLCVNVSNYLLSTFMAGWVFSSLADMSRSPISTERNIIATIAAAFVFNLVNTGIIASILSLVLGATFYQTWRNNLRGVAFEFLTLPTLGALVPVLYAQNPVDVLFVTVPLMGPYYSFKRYTQIHYETRSTIELLADMLDRRDPYTAEHSKRVTEFVQMIMNEMGTLTFEEREAILVAAPVHDLGKIGTTDLVLSKPGKLTDEEREIIKQHAAEGASILGILSMYREASTVVRNHHERWDGRGYPDGLSGEEIPIGSRIIAVADTYDAMTSDRVYRKALTHQIAMAEIRRGAGTQFDPTIVEAFVRAMGEQPVVVEVATANVA